MLYKSQKKIWKVTKFVLKVGKEIEVSICFTYVTEKLGNNKVVEGDKSFTNLGEKSWEFTKLVNGNIYFINLTEKLTNL